MHPGRLSRTTAVLGLAFVVMWSGCGGGADIAEPAVGTLEITTETSGPEADADGYAVSIDGAAAEPVGVNATVRYAGLAVGAHTVELTNLAPNCTLTGDARLDVTVSTGAVAAARFTVTCAPTTGSIQVTTIAGDPADPDGYTLLLDGVAGQSIAASATLTLQSVAPGTHTVGLAGIALDCSAEGENPRAVSVIAGQATVVAISVSCTPPAPGTGNLTVTTATTGTSPDPDGYTVSLDGGSPRTVADGAGVTFDGLEPRSHTVRLGGVASNCDVQGQNPRSVTVVEGATAVAAVTVTCTATTGSLAITIAGLPGGTNASVTVTGPNGFSQPVTSTGTLSDLQPGGYTVAAAAVTNGGTTYTPSPASRTVTVAAAGAASVTVTYTGAAAPTLNLRIDGWSLSQSVQNPAGDVPLVDNRDGYLRVFVLANRANTAKPSVRVRLYRNAGLVATFTIAAPGASVPTSRDEGRLSSTWNVKIPRTLVTPGLGVLADVDPGGAIPEQDETDNVFPASGTPETETVRSVPLLAISFIPVRQGASGPLGDVTLANRPQYFDLTRRMHPTAVTDANLHLPYATDQELQPGDANGGWGTLLGDIEALRVAEGSDRNYYAVVHVDYAAGIVGLGLPGGLSAVGYDADPDRARVMAHELGHNWGRMHSPCGSPGGVDPDYPYAGGVIGVYGLDMRDGVLKPPTSPDIMGNCTNSPWVSDYTYRGVLDFRATASARAAATAVVDAVAQPCLLVWGRIVDGRPVLEPAFEVTTRPSLPKAPGPYTVQGLAADGARVFDLAFDAPPVADDPRGSRHFAFAVPLGAAGGRLEHLRLAGPAGAADAERTVAPAAAATVEPVTARRVPGGVVLRWDVAAHPMLMVRDPDTGQVLSFARGGVAEIATAKRELSVIASDRVRSQAARVVAR